jgi:hypothetical protein
MAIAFASLVADWASVKQQNIPRIHPPMQNEIREGTGDGRPPSPPAPPPRAVNPPPPPAQPQGFRDYIVYVDESGDHGLDTMDPTYPVFVLAFCIFEKQEYISSAVPRLQSLKFQHFGHDMVVMHESEIRKAKGNFAFLVNAANRGQFMDDLSTLVEECQFTLIATAIRKDKLKDAYARRGNPYHIAMKFGLERVAKLLAARRQASRITYVVVEKRGLKEDNELELEFRRICDGANYRGETLPLRLVFADKRVNSCGLQIADLVARPIGRHVINETQPNRAFEILKAKFDKSPTGNYRGYGLKCFP